MIYRYDNIKYVNNTTENLSLDLLDPLSEETKKRFINKNFFLRFNKFSSAIQIEDISLLFMSISKKFAVFPNLKLIS